MDIGTNRLHMIAAISFGGVIVRKVSLVAQTRADIWNVLDPAEKLLLLAGYSILGRFGTRNTAGGSMKPVLIMTSEDEDDSAVYSRSREFISAFSIRGAYGLA